METTDGAHEREVSAARNQAMFRAVNERIKDIDEGFGPVTEMTIVCECADAACVERLALRPDVYERIRANPRNFAVLPGHVYPEIEDVVFEADGLCVVEKRETAGEVADVTARATPAQETAS